MWPHTGKRAAAFATGVAVCHLIFVAPAVLAASPNSQVQKFDKIGALKLLRQGNLREVERRLSAVQDGYLANKLSETYVANAIGAFRCADPALERKLEAWTERFPKSIAAHLARGAYHRYFGFARRGTGFSSQTDRSQFDAMAKHFAKARQSYETALSFNKRIPEAYSGLIHMAMANGPKADIARAYQRALQSVPDATEPHWRFAFSLRREWSGSPDLLRKFIEDAKSKSDTVPGLAALRFYFDRYNADQAFHRRDYAAAISIYNSILEQVPSARDLYLRGRVHFYANDDTKAISDLNRSLGLNTDGPRSLHLLGQISSRRGELRQALSYFTKSIEIEPFSAKYRLARANAFVALGQMEMAEKEFDRALDCNSFDAKVHTARADFFKNYRHDHSKAAKAAAQLTRIAPKNAGYWRRYSDALFFLRECEFLTASAQYLRVCLHGKQCGEKEAAHVALMAEAFRSVTSCKR